MASTRPLGPLFLVEMLLLTCMPACCGTASESKLPARPIDIPKPELIDPLRLPQKKDTFKNYLNISLPGLSCFSPFVLVASDQEAVVARVSFVDGNRDIQVLIGHGEHWDYLGPQGRALTGVDGNFLRDAKQGPDGRLWILAGYTPPSNQQRGGKDYLYCLEKDEWRIAGPPRGAPGADFAEKGLYFLGSNEPVHLFAATSNENQEARVLVHFVRLEGGDWVPLPAQDLLRKHHEKGIMTSRKNDAWWFVPSVTDGRTELIAYWLKGPRAADIFGPIHLGSWNSKLFLPTIAVSETGDIAVQGWETPRQNMNLNDATSFGRLFRAQGGGRFAETELPALTSELDNSAGSSERRATKSHGRTIDRLEWSPKGELFGLHRIDEQHIAVFILTATGWKMRGEARQPVASGIIYEPRLFIRSNGEPIVVWEDFKPL